MVDVEELEQTVDSELLGVRAMSSFSSSRLIVTLLVDPIASNASLMLMALNLSLVNKNGCGLDSEYFPALERWNQGLLWCDCLKHGTHGMERKLSKNGKQRNPYIR